MRFRLPLIVTLLVAAFGLGACDTSAYHRSGGQWKHGDFSFTPEDPRTFQPIDRLYAKDAIRGYYRGTAVADSDGATFAVVSEHEARDRDRVYYCDTYRKGQEYWSIRHLRIVPIAGADPATYASIGLGHARDKRRVYDEGVAFDVRDPATYEPLDGNFGRDSHRAYYAHVEIAGSDGPSFAIVDARDSAYARDRSRAYYGYRDIDAARAPHTKPPESVRVLRSADPAALRVLGRDYAVDDRHVWYRGLQMDGADPSTFIVDTRFQGAADAADKFGAWDRGRRLAAPR
jgi:hypothetical protein